MLKTLYPALITYAKRELAFRGRTPELAEDLVQTATTRWIEVITTERAARRYLRAAIRGLAANLDREGRDAMTHHPSSLEQIQED